MPSSVIVVGSCTGFPLRLDVEDEFLIFLGKFHRNCFGLSVELSTLKKRSKYYQKNLQKKKKIQVNYLLVCVNINYK